MITIVILGILCCLSLLFGFICFIKLLDIKRQLKYIIESLKDIQSGNSKQKILAADNELTADISYKLNEIIYDYEEELSKFKALDETNRQLMTNLSHDVRTPLTTLIGYLDAIYKGVVTQNDYEEYLKVARQKAHDLKEYIDILFDWFRLNSSELSLAIEKTELAEFTRNILKDWIPIFEEKSLDCEIDIPEEPFFAKVDLDCYNRIINNLVQNVMSHSKATQIKIKMSKKETDIEISIEDNGRGIEKSDLQHIFERLYKCDKGRSNKGSGLGLAIVWQLVEKMEGRITVQSEPNQYTIFSICFCASN